MNCESATLYKYYYTYLCELPIKLTHNGKLVDSKVERKTFKEKEYLVLKALYNEALYSDIWFSYNDPHAYALKVY